MLPPQYVIRKNRSTGKKKYHPILLDGSVSGEGFARASEAIDAERFARVKAIELCEAEGWAACDEGLDIMSNPYIKEMGQAWKRGWEAASAEAEMLDEEAES